MSIAKPKVRDPLGSHMADLRRQRRALRERMHWLMEEIREHGNSGRLERRARLVAQLEELKRAAARTDWEIKQAESGNPRTITARRAS